MLVSESIVLCLIWWWWGHLMMRSFDDEVIWWWWFPCVPLMVGFENSWMKVEFSVRLVRVGKNQEKTRAPAQPQHVSDWNTKNKYHRWQLQIPNTEGNFIFQRLRSITTTNNRRFFFQITDVMELCRLSSLSSSSVSSCEPSLSNILIHLSNFYACDENCLNMSDVL